MAELRRAVRGGTDLSAVVALLCDEALIVRDRPTGSRKSTTFRYRRRDQACPAVDLAAYQQAYQQVDATRLLVRGYVGRYGPVSMAGILWWTGLPARRIRAAVASLAEEVTAITVPGITGELLTPDTGQVYPDQPPGEVPSVRLLPQLDPCTMGYHDRARLVDPAHHQLIYDRGGNATSVVLADGKVAGVWDLTEAPAPAARLLLFSPDAPHRQEALGQAAAAGEFWFGHQVPVHEYTEMVPARQRTGVMRKPLDGARPGTGRPPGSARPGAQTTGKEHRRE